MMMGFGLMGVVLMLIFWGTLMLGAVWLVKSIFPGVREPGGRENLPISAREILDQRYARGEITREQYLAMIEDVQKTV
jgi:putative membrane protein